MTNTLKAIDTNTDLVCDFDDLRSTLLITEIENPPSFTLETPPDTVVICWERDREPPQQRGPDIEFELKQEPTLYPNDGGDNGLRVNSTDNGDGTRTVTWDFIVDNAGGLNTEVLEWHLKPVDQNDLVCGGAKPCVNRMGVPASPRASDFTDRDVTDDGMPDFGSAGVVFRYTELVLSNGTRLPESLLFGPCHSGSYVATDPILCERTIRVEGQRQVVSTRTLGNIPAALPVEVEIKPETLNADQTSGTHDIRILGEATLTLNPPLLVEELVVNGNPLASNEYTGTYTDISGDGFTDFVAKVERRAFNRVINCSINGPTRIVVTGIIDDPQTNDPDLDDETPFRGEDTIDVINCS